MWQRASINYTQHSAGIYRLRSVRWSCCLQAPALHVFCWIVVKADRRHRKRWVDMTQLLLVDNSKILHLAFFPNPERQMVEWPDPTLFLYARFKVRVYVAHFLGIIAKPVTLCFLIGIIFVCRLKKVKIPNRKQQFTAAICLSKGCPDYPRWEDSFQQRLIKNFNSSTLNNSLYCTVAPRTRPRFFYVICHLSSCRCFQSGLIVTTFVGDRKWSQFICISHVLHHSHLLLGVGPVCG